MSQRFVFAQARDIPGQRRTIQIRGVFSQKKKLWESAILTQFPKEQGYTLYDDVAKKSWEIDYGRLCILLTKMGRAVIVDRDGSRIVAIKALSDNEISNWDTDDMGEPVPNPVILKDGEQEGQG